MWQHLFGHHIKCSDLRKIRWQNGRWKVFVGKYTIIQGKRKKYLFFVQQRRLSGCLLRILRFVFNFLKQFINFIHFSTTAYTAVVRNRNTTLHLVHSETFSGVCINSQCQVKRDDVFTRLQKSSDLNVLIRLHQL